MSIKITWHGHASLSLETNGTNILVDPFFDENPACERSSDDIPADFILVSHAHFDHVGDVLGVATRTGATVISNLEIINWLQNQGHEKGHPQQTGGGYDHPFGRVKLTPAWHGSMFPDGGYGGLASGFLLTIDGKKIYISGDTGLFGDMALIGDEGLDLAVICIGDNFTMGPDDALKAVKFLKPKEVIPYHYNTWPPIEVDVQAWAKRVAAETSSRPVVLQVEESHTI